MESVIASSFNDRAGNPQKRTLELSRGMASSAGNGQRSNQQHLFRRRIFQSGARRHSAILSARAKSCLLAQAIEQFCPSPLNQYALLDETDKTSGQARPSSASKDNAVDPTPSLLSFGEAIALTRQRLNVSSGRAAALIREALKSRELRIIRDDHIDPISSSLFAIVEEDFLGCLNRHASTTATTPQAARKQPDRELVRQAAIELWGTPGPPDHLSNLSICREVAQWLKKNDQAAEISDATILRAVGRK